MKALILATAALAAVIGSARAESGIALHYSTRELGTKTAPLPEQIHLRRIVHIGREAAREGSLRRNQSRCVVQRNDAAPLTLAAKLRTTFADVVSSSLPRLAALVSRLQADRNESSGEEGKWGMQ